MWSLQDHHKLNNKKKTNLNVEGEVCASECMFKDPSWLWHVFVCASTADIISTVEFNHTGELLATGDKGGRVVIFQQEIEVRLPIVDQVHL